MSRTSMAVLALAAWTVVSLPSAALTPARGSGYHYGFDNDDDKDQLGWVLLKGGHNSSSSLNNEDLDDIKARFGREFLYIRDGSDRYVIRDRRLMQRAEDSMKPIQEAGREIGRAVGDKVGYSVGRSQGSREQARLVRRIDRVSSRIDRLSERDEDTQDLEIELNQLQRQLDTLKGDRGRRHDDEEREADLDAANQRASRHMREAIRKVNQD